MGREIIDWLKRLARIRKKLKLTQREAALLTGGGPNAFSRYEGGKAKPIQAVSNLFKLLDKHPHLLDELKSNQTRQPKRPYIELFKAKNSIIAMAMAKRLICEFKKP